MAPATDDASADDPLAARRRRILDAATRVFAEKGFERATIRDIARGAGVADGTIYNYFANKPALLLALLDRLNETGQRESHFTGGAEADVSTFLRGYLAQRFATLARSDFDILQVLLSEVLVNQELRDRYYREVIAPTFAIGEGALLDRAAEGSLRSLDPVLTSRVLAGMVLGVVLLRLLGDPPLQQRWDEVPDVLATLVLEGLLSAQGGHHDADQRP